MEGQWVAFQGEWQVGKWRYWVCGQLLWKFYCGVERSNGTFSEGRRRWEGEYGVYQDGRYLSIITCEKNVSLQTKMMVRKSKRVIDTLEKAERTDLGHGPLVEERHFVHWDWKKEGETHACAFGVALRDEWRGLALSEKGGEKGAGRASGERRR